MLTAAKAIAAWEATRNLTEILIIDDTDALTLPPLPAGLTRLFCNGCTGLTCLPALPTGLTHLSCYDCPGLTSIPALSAGLVFLFCHDCTRLMSQPTLRCSTWTALPDACPSTLMWFNCSPVDRRLWRLKVAEQHARQRSAVAAVLPPFALLYV